MTKSIEVKSHDTICGIDLKLWSLYKNHVDKLNKESELFVKEQLRHSIEKESKEWESYRIEEDKYNKLPWYKKSFRVAPWPPSIHLDTDYFFEPTQRTTSIEGYLNWLVDHKDSVDGE